MAQLPGGEADEPDRRERPLVGGRYRLEGDAPVGTGVRGEVWRATDTLLERVVALKRVLLVVSVAVLASVPDDQRCQMARTLAARVVPRLPAQ